MNVSSEIISSNSARVRWTSNRTNFARAKQALISGIEAKPKSVIFQRKLLNSTFIHIE